VIPILAGKRICFVTYWRFWGKAGTAEDTENEQEMNGSIDRLAPGTFVRSPANPDWGLGQVQSAIGDKVTVNFEHRGKLVLHLTAAPLVVVEPSSEDANR
jgi:Protein of unknown function (DUF3553)